MDGLLTNLQSNHNFLAKEKNALLGAEALGWEPRLGKE